MLHHTLNRILHVILDMGKRDERPELTTLAARIGASCTTTLDALSALDRMGLVDADRVRLTMAGLVLAASSSAKADAAPRRSVRMRRRAA